VSGAHVTRATGFGFDSAGVMLLAGVFANVLDVGAGPMVAVAYTDGFFARLTQ